MERIQGQPPGFRDLATRVLSWITTSRRPLATLELRSALAVTTGASAFDQYNLTEIELIVSVCAGLVTVDEKSDIIRLVHYTTQEYFERTRGLWFPDAQTKIAEICVTYLVYDAFETGFCATDEEFEARLQQNPLYDYAARNWGHHARVASKEVVQLILDFLESEAKVSAVTAVVGAGWVFGQGLGLPAGLSGLTGPGLLPDWSNREDREGELLRGGTIRTSLENDYIEYKYPHRHRHTLRCRPC